MWEVGERFKLVESSAREREARKSKNFGGKVKYEERERRVWIQTKKIERVTGSRAYRQGAEYGRQNKLYTGLETLRFPVEW